MKKRLALKLTIGIIISLSVVIFVLKIILLDSSSIPEKSNLGITVDEISSLAGNDGNSLPLRINRIMIIKTTFPQWMVIAGGADKDFPNSVPAYQVVYRDKTVIIDPACNTEQWEEIAAGEEFLFYKDNYEKLQQSMRKAAYIIATHEHSDHIGGIGASPYLEEINNKIVFTEEQIQSKWTKMAGFTDKTLNALTPLRYERLHRLLPGLVLIKTPGHTPGHQMIFVKLQNGRQLLLIGDAVWNSANVRELKNRPLLASLFLSENRKNVANQIRWLHDEIYFPEKGVVPVVYHDYTQLEILVKDGIIGDGFEL